MDAALSGIVVEVVYAEAQFAIIKTFRVAETASVGDVLQLAAADPGFAAIDMARATVGIFGRTAGANHGLKDQDRIEIYRPLAADPKNARRARAREARKKR